MNVDPSESAQVSYRPISVGFEDADSDTITTFKIQPDGRLRIVMEDRAGRMLGVTEAYLDDVIACLKEAQRRALSPEAEVE